MEFNAEGVVAAVSLVGVPGGWEPARWWERAALSGARLSLPVPSAERDCDGNGSQLDCTGILTEMVMIMDCKFINSRYFLTMQNQNS